MNTPRILPSKRAEIIGKFIELKEEMFFQRNGLRLENPFTWKTLEKGYICVFHKGTFLMSVDQQGRFSVAPWMKEELKKQMHSDWQSPIHEGTQVSFEDDVAFCAYTDASGEKVFEIFKNGLMHLTVTRYTEAILVEPVTEDVADEMVEVDHHPVAA